MITITRAMWLNATLYGPPAAALVVSVVLGLLGWLTAAILVAAAAIAWYPLWAVAMMLWQPAITKWVNGD
jgi:hypothetical protein